MQGGRWREEYMDPALSRQQIESARLKMLEARQALEDHERVKGYAPSSEHQKLFDVFKKATQKYLQISRTQH